MDGLPLPGTPSPTESPPPPSWCETSRPASLKQLFRCAIKEPCYEIELGEVPGSNPSDLQVGFFQQVQANWRLLGLSVRVNNLCVCDWQNVPLILLCTY